MTHITDVLAVRATGACEVRDGAALRDHPMPAPEQDSPAPVTSGLHGVREVAKAVSIGLVIGDATEGPPFDGLIVWGDCTGTAYPSAAGRAGVFRSADGLAAIRRSVAPILKDREVTTFREMAGEMDALTEKAQVPAPEAEEPDTLRDVAQGAREGLSRRDLLIAPFRALQQEPSRARPAYVTVERPIHPAIRYGVSQALLKAVALARQRTMAAVIADEWDLPRPGRPIPIHAQTGPDRRRDAERMIVRHVDSFPHALVENVPEHLGEDGEQLVGYVRWLKERIAELGGTDYRPAIHLDLHGSLGHIYENNLGRILGYLYRLESSARPYTLRVESPVIMESRAAQIETMKTLREYVRFRGMAVQIVADEWADTREDVQAFVDAEAADMIHINGPQLGSIGNSVEAVLACKQGRVGVLLGGSCTETDLAARVAAHVALATQPDLVLARPGLDVGTAVSTMRNEMARAVVLIKAHDL